MKLRLLQALTIAFVLACGFTAGYHWPHRALTSRAYERGITEMTWALADCSLADAHAERCFIPCSTDTDCMEKNGQTDH